jgi:cobalt-zinc-cadmium efflux system protein
VTHRHANPTRTQLWWAVILTTLLTGVEIAGAFQSASLALWGEAAHFVSDGWAFAVALYALSGKPDDALSYGRGQMLALGSFINALLQLAIGIAIAGVALHHVITPEPVEGGWMLGVAVLGLVTNGVFLRLFGGVHMHEDTAIEGARIHFLADFALCGGTVLAALLVWALGWTLADPVLALLAAGVMGVSALRLGHRAGHVLLAGVPREIDLPDVHRDLLEVAGVIGVHDLHVWQVGRERMASVHVFAPDLDAPRILEGVDLCLKNCGITHTTIQVERVPCETPCFLQVRDGAEGRLPAH